ALGPLPARDVSVPGLAGELSPPAHGLPRVLNLAAAPLRTVRFPVAAPAPATQPARPPRKRLHAPRARRPFPSGRFVELGALEDHASQRAGPRRLPAPRGHDAALHGAGKR